MINPRCTRLVAVGLLICLVGAWPNGARAEDAVAAGELIVERPTLISLGFDWRVTGDANDNATAKAQYASSRPVERCGHWRARRSTVLADKETTTR